MKISVEDRGKIAGAWDFSEEDWKLGLGDLLIRSYPKVPRTPAGDAWEARRRARQGRAGLMVDRLLAMTGARRGEEALGYLVYLQALHLGMTRKGWAWVDGLCPDGKRVVGIKGCGPLRLASAAAASGEATALATASAEELAERLAIDPRIRGSAVEMETGSPRNTYAYMLASKLSDAGRMGLADGKLQAR